MKPFITHRILSVSAGWLLTGLLHAGALSAGMDTPTEAGAAETWGDSTTVVPYGRYYIASQPDLAALEHAQERGVTLVISLRSEKEFDWDETAATQSLGLEFQRVAVDGSLPELDPEPFGRVTDLVQSRPDAVVMVHCASGNRAAAWLAAYLHEAQGRDSESAMEVARRTGLTSEGLERKLRAYLERPAEVD